MPVPNSVETFFWPKNVWPQFFNALLLSIEFALVLPVTFRNSHHKQAGSLSASRKRIEGR